LKVIGGKRTHSGRLGAFITNVKPDSVADQLAISDLATRWLEWNGCSLKSLDFQEVYDILWPVGVTTRAASQESKRSAAAANAGRIQLKFWYDFDSASLSVGLLSAFNLVPRPGTSCPMRSLCSTCCPYLKISYSRAVTEDDIRDGSLRVEVLDYDDFNGSESIGEVEIVLSDCKFNDQPNWFRLASRWESNATPTPV
uniref:PLAT domain-containing protein n=1 Tax=Macrostomum lignano TaxID=282301 RepID=A0A1I8FG61_9PLAT